MRHRSLLKVLLALWAVALGSTVLADDSNGVPNALLSKFDRGVNVTRWFCYQQTYGEDQLQHYFGDADYAELQLLHVHFVRLCLAPEAIYDSGHLKAATVPYLDSALRRLTRAGMAVVYDLHDNGQLKLDAEGQDNSGFVSFWEDTTRHYKDKFESSVVFELVNEPQFQRNPQVWYALQAKTVAAIRAIDPKRTIMVSGTSWSGIETLTSMEPLAESNLIYTFHCYDPFFFTHQGASWVGHMPKDFKGIPFPSSPEAVNKIIDQIPADGRDAVRGYGEQRLDAKYLLGRLRMGSDWGHAHHVPVVLGEFGSYPPVAPVDSRERWFAAMRDAIAALHLPNALWGYDDAMGLGREKNADGTLKLEPATLNYLYGKQ